MRKGNRKIPKVTRLINCPFAASAYFQKKKGHWRFRVSNPAHNHPSSLDPSAHTTNRQLTKSLYEEMKKLGDAGLKPLVILATLKKTHPDETILATISTIYTARKKATQEMLQGISPIVHLHQTLQKSDFTTAARTDDEGNLTALFFCHTRSVELLCSYHYILFLDCTYKTNRYKMPLLHITGITGTNKSFSLAFCFLRKETQDYYEWALQNLLNIFTSHEIPLPEVVITDREQALINSLSQTFPNAYHMLCIWHIEKNLVTNGTKYIKNKTSEHAMIKKWNDLIRLSSPSDFSASFSIFSSQFGAAFQKYMDSQWLPVAEKYLNAWTKSITHFDNRTTS
jgi:hypothetical protein